MNNGRAKVDCVGYRLKEEQPYRLDPEMWVYLKAYRIPARPAFKVKPWWSVDIMRPNGTRETSITMREGDEVEVKDLPPGMYWIRLNGLVKATPRELRVHACILAEGHKTTYPLQRKNMPRIEAGVLPGGTEPKTGESLNLAGLTKSYLLFQPTEVVKGKGHAEVYLEHSSDDQTWEPVSHGGFPSSKIIIDQSKPGTFREEMCLVGGIKQYVRWAYNPTDVLGWGIRGRFFYEKELRHA